MAPLANRSNPLRVLGGLAALTALFPLVTQGGSAGSLLLAGRVDPRQRTRVETRFDHFSPALAGSSGGTELAHISHQSNSGEGFQLLVSDSRGGTLSLNGQEVPYSVEVERAHPIRPGKDSTVLKTQAGTLRPSIYNFTLRLRTKGGPKLSSRASASHQAPTLTLSIVAL